MCLKVGLWRIDLKDFFLCPLFPFSPRGIIDSDKKCSSDTKAIVSKGYHSLYILQERNIVHTQEKYFQQKMFDRTNISVRLEKESCWTFRICHFLHVVLHNFEH